LNSLCAVGGCGTIPDAFALIRASRFYKQAPQFLATRGPVSTAEGKDIIARLERQTGKTDILTRHLAFEQAISDSPLILGDRDTLLENARAAYPAMLDASHSARS
jgi:cardiolipin synthase